MRNKLTNPRVVSASCGSATCFPDTLVLVHLLHHNLQVQTICRKLVQLHAVPCTLATARLSSKAAYDGAPLLDMPHDEQGPT